MSRTNPEDARQGRKGKPVLRVLIIALLLCVVAAAIMAVYGSSMSGDTPPAGKVGNGDATSSSAPSDATAPAAPATTNSMATPGDAGTNTTAPATSN